MIDLRQEALITLGEAAKLVPCRRKDTEVSPTTLWRWIKKGVGGIRLEALRLPSGYVTSAEAVQRFANRLTAEHEADWITEEALQNEEAVSQESL